MKKLLLTVSAALLMSFTAIAQTATMQRIDLSKCKIMPRPEGVTTPKTIQTDLKTTKDCLFNAPDGHARAFGFNVFDYRFRTNAVVDFTTDDALNYQMMLDYGQVPQESYGFFCATFVEDKIFAYCYQYYGPGALVPVSMGFIDPQTGVFTESFRLSHDNVGLVLSDMTYDPVTKLVYAAEIQYQDGWPTGTSVIYSIDPFKAEDTIDPIADVKGECYTLSYDQGALYSIVPIKKLDGVTNKDCKLIKMPLNTLNNGEIDVIDVNKDGLKVVIGWAQSMEFDKINHRLWWFGQTLDDKAFFADVDVNTGKINTRQNFSTVSQVVALSIPYQYVPSKAPSYPLNLKAERGAEGARTVNLSWTNPTKDYDLNELSSLSEIKILRDGVEVGKAAASGIGADQKYQDTDVPDGVHIYAVKGVNESGEGVYKEVKVFIGHDLPTGPLGVTVKVDENDPCSATVSWTAPTYGVNGGWIDQTTLKYDVVRFPGEVKIASDITECSLVDRVEKNEGYYYEVTSKNADGTGGKTKSKIVVFGPDQTIPFYTKLNKQDEFNKWTVIDNNHDAVTWFFNDREDVTCYDRGEGPADDYLISPELQFEEGKKYQLRFKYWTINWVDPSDHSPILDKMDIYYAQEPEVDAFKKEGTILDLGEFHTPSETYLYAKQVFTAKPGKGHIAFHAYSDPYRSIIYVQDISIREYSKTDISITDLRGSITLVEGAKESFVAEVTNEGSAAVDKYTVELINSKTGEVLATADGVSLRSGQKAAVNVEWIPNVTGDISISARVNLEGDTYPLDNTWGKDINATVKPSGSDRWITVNQDDSYEDAEGNCYNKGQVLPFAFGYGQSAVQCIYLSKEMFKKDITLTGVKFVCDAFDSEEGNPHVKVSAMGTDRNYFEWDTDNNMTDAIDFLDANWMVLFDDTVTFGGKDHNTSLEIPFKDYFYYNGGNIAVMYELYDIGGIFARPMFHYHDTYDDGELERQRIALSKGHVAEDVNPFDVGTMAYSPFTMFSYKEGEVDGIIGVTAEGLSFDIAGGMLTMNDVCDVITVYDVDGKVVAEVRNSNLLSLGSLHGAYVIKAVSGSKVVNCKVSL